MGKVKKHPWAGKDGHERDFIKLVHEIGRSRGYRQVLDDFLELAYCAIAKRTYPAAHEWAEALEARYMETVARREPEYIRRMPELLALAQVALGPGGGGGDFLGRIAGELGALNGEAGQFFTPFEVSKMMASISLHDAGHIIKENGFITIGEPASGAGGMLLAAAEVLEEQGYDPGIVMFCEAVDISSTAFKMTYLQLALRGIPANVICGDTLSLKSYERAVTPAKIPFVLHHGPRWVAYLEGSRAAPVDRSAETSAQVALPPPQPVPAGRAAGRKAPSGQLSLFS